MNGVRAMKPSGLEWVGDIPFDWKVIPLARCCREPKMRNSGNRETNVLSLSYGKIVRRDVETNHGLLPETFETYQILEPGFIVLRLTDLQNDQRSLRVGLAPERGIITSAYVALQPEPELESNYLFYLLHSYDVAKVFYGFGGGVRQSMRFDDFKMLPVFVPPLREQRAIAGFLDRKTAAIDELIRAKERLIELLQEKRQALITRAVTKGLDPSVAMKDSGVEWLGEVPAHWELKRVKDECRFLNHRRVPLSVSERSTRSGPFPYYGASGVIDHIDEFIFDGPSVLIAEDGANLVLRNLPLAIVAEGRYWVNNHAHILRPDDGQFEYWAALLESLDFTPFVVGSAQPKLTKEALGNTLIALPPSVPERQAIAKFAQTVRHKTVEVIDVLRLSRARLTELREESISASVSGRLRLMN